jgi:2-keto-4-pentenoate hydratase
LRFRHAWRLAAGEVVITGTLTRAYQVRPGEIWSTSLSGIPLPGLSLRFG